MENEDATAPATVAQPNYGLFRGIENKAYHAHPALSKSGLDKLNKSPAHYKASRELPHKETPAMRVGTMLHMAVLEPVKFESKYKRLPDSIGKLHHSSNKYKEGLLEWQIENPGVLVIDDDDYTMANRIRDNIQNHAMAKACLVGGESELSAFWHDDEFGIDGKCRPDWYRMNGVIIDLKSTEDASPVGFQRSVANYRYHVQAAWYKDGLTAAIKAQVIEAVLPVGFVCIAVEKEEPYAVATYEIGPAEIEKGRELYRRDLVKFAEAQRTNVWPAYPEELIPVGLPGWAWSQ